MPNGPSELDPCTTSTDGGGNGSHGGAYGGGRGLFFFQGSNSFQSVSSASAGAHAASRGAMKPFYVRTPLMRSRELSASAGLDVLLKLENLQPSGSFKLRGVGATAQSALESGATRLIGCSAGNAGLAMAYVAESLGQKDKLSLFVPENSNPLVVEKLKSYG